MTRSGCGSVVLALLLGCGSTQSPNVATTIGEQCTEILSAFCTRAFDQCGATAVADGGGADGAAAEGGDGGAPPGDAGPPADGGSSPISQCVTSGVALCCQQSGDCNAGAITPEGYIQACVSDMNAAPCANLLAQPPALPETCQQVIRKPQ